MKDMGFILKIVPRKPYSYYGGENNMNGKNKYSGKNFRTLQ